MSLIGTALIKNKQGVNEMSKITYDFYCKNDAVAVVNLMKSNNFWMGKYNPDLGVDTFNKYQEEKGFEFGIVGKIDNKVISYVAAYKHGSQRICKRHQLIISGLVIDRKYRMAVFSLSQMFEILLLKCVKLGINDIIAEVNVKNNLSLSMMKKTGFLVLEDKPTIFGEYVLHNYMPSLLRFFDSKGIENPDMATMRIDPKKITQKADFISSDTISVKWSVKDLLYEFYINVEDGEILGVHCHDRFKIIRIDNDTICYHKYVNESGFSWLTINYVCSDNEYTKEIIAEGEETNITIPEGVLSLKISPESEPDGYCFFSQNYEYPSNNEMKIQSKIFDRNSGYLYFHNKFFCVLWPCIDYPYLESPLTPKYDKQLKIKTKKNIIDAVYTTQHYLLNLKYEVSTNRIVINTQTNLFETFEFDRFNPIFHLSVNSNSGEIILANSNNQYVYELSNLHNVFSELMFEDFKNDYSDDTQFTSITFRVEDAEYILKSAVPFYAVVNMNYVAIRFDFSKNKQMESIIKFPQICIERV